MSSAFMRATAFVIIAVLAGIVAILAYKSSLLLQTRPVAEILFSSEWNPLKGEFGFIPIILGTIYVTGLAMVVAVPVSVLSAIYVAEYLPARLRHTVKSFIDVLAGIPSVVYGMCAILVLVPFVRDVLAPAVGVDSTGFCILSAALILAVMVFPIIISICVDVFRAVPFEVREVSRAMGATQWETTKLVVLRGAPLGVFSAVLLGFGRAFGETIAVAMVVGNLPRTPSSLLDSATTLPAVIASTYGEMMSIPLYDSAMMLLALLLIIVVMTFNILARVVQHGFERVQGRKP